MSASTGYNIESFVIAVLQTDATLAALDIVHDVRSTEDFDPLMIVVKAEQAEPDAQDRPGGTALASRYNIEIALQRDVNDTADATEDDLWYRVLNRLANMASSGVSVSAFATLIYDDATFSESRTWEDRKTSRTASVQFLAK